MIVSRYTSTNTNACNVLFLFLILFINGQGLIQDAAANNGIPEKWDRLLIEEIPSLKENLEGIINTLDEGNYTIVSEQIDDIKSGGHWSNVRKELESRNEADLISSFNNSLSRLDKLVATKNISSIGEAQILSKDFKKMEQALAQPVIDFQRLLLIVFIIGTLIAFGLYIIPKVRKKLDIKF